MEQMFYILLCTIITTGFNWFIETRREKRKEKKLS